MHDLGCLNEEVNFWTDFAVVNLGESESDEILQA